MAINDSITMGAQGPYKGSLTKEQFLFYEMRTTAQLLSDGYSDEAAIQKICDENLFQYPTERMIKPLAIVCVSRLHLLNDQNLIAAVASQPIETAKQICLYAMMKHSRLVWDFMVTVIGEKYRMLDLSFSKLDLNIFFMRLQEQNDYVAKWSESTVTKIKQVLTRVLVENEYLDHTKADHINPVLLNPMLENVIRANGDEAALPAFNCIV